MTRRFPLLLCAMLALAAPLPVPAQEAAASTPELPLTARGNEPFWSILATPEGLSLTEPEGKGTVQTLPFTRTIEGGSLVLTTTDFTLRIAPALCHDDMSGMPYPFTATLTRTGATLNGCAGDPAALLAGDWTVTQLDTGPLPAGINVTLSFSDGRVAGNSGCNRLSGGYALTGEGLSFTAIATTRMACPAPQMETEQSVLAALASITRFDFTADGHLLLQSDEGITALTARR